ncbi:MAG: hypothetical protein ACFE9S_05770 [Candidatus Hermodarchaeota archaeon]
MVFKNIQRIQAALPEVKHIAMFYNNGIIFQTTFDQEINIPKLGENLAEILNHARKLYEVSHYNFENYKKIIFETYDMSIIILKLGEDSNIALFFKKEEEKELKLTAIKRYITRIEELIDMDERELIIQDILAKEEEFKHLKELIAEKEKVAEELNTKLIIVERGEIEGEKKQILSELNSINVECVNLRKDLEKINNEITQLKEKIEKSHKKE